MDKKQKLVERIEKLTDKQFELLIQLLEGGTEMRGDDE